MKENEGLKDIKRFISKAEEDTKSEPTGSLEMNEHAEGIDSFSIKPKKSSRLLISFLLVITLILIMLFFVSCSQNVDFLNSQVVPAAHGSVRIKSDFNKNYIISIQISDLAEPGKLQPPKKGYVAWIETDQGSIENIGQITSATGFFSGQMHANLKTVSSYKPKKVFITAENDINLQLPGTFTVLSTEMFN
jgi:hypothetical protein